jgi:hypothetical protein
MDVSDIEGETLTAHLRRRLTAEADDISDRMDERLRRYNSKQKEALLRCIDLIGAAWPGSTEEKIEAVEVLHLSARIEFLKATEISA